MMVMKEVCWPSERFGLQHSFLLFFFTSPFFFSLFPLFFTRESIRLIAWLACLVGPVASQKDLF